LFYPLCIRFIRSTSFFKSFVLVLNFGFSSLDVDA